MISYILTCKCQYEREKKKLILILLPEEIMIEIFEFLDPTETKRIFRAIPQLHYLASPYLVERREIICYHKKIGFEEDVLGFGIRINYHSFFKNKIDSIVSPLEFISKSAFYNENIRKSVWREDFKYWLPMFIHPRQIVETMKGNIHASIKSLDGYFYFHRLLIALVQKYPKMLEMINEKVKNFISNEKYRTKEYVDNLGDFLALLSVSDYEWYQVSPFILNESLCRNVQWIIKDHPNYNSYGEAKFIDKCFESTKVSRNLIMFHELFLRSFARPKGKSLNDIAQDYDMKYGQSTLKRDCYL